MRNLCHLESAAAQDPPNSYIRVEWKHEYDDDPITLYSELDEERWEVRKVEMFRDGHVTWADAKGSIGTTQLGDQPVPAVAEIAANQEFVVKEISRAEFEAAWDAAFESDAP
jgi:hypothetical protein